MTDEQVWEDFEIWHWNVIKTIALNYLFPNCSKLSYPDFQTFRNPENKSVPNSLYHQKKLWNDPYYRKF